MATTKNRPLKRKSVFVPEPEIRSMTIPEVLAFGGDPREGQDARFGKGEEQVERLWNYKDLAREIHRSAQASMLARVNMEFCTLNGKVKRTGGNRTLLALQYLFEQHGSENVDVVIDSVSPTDGRPLKLTHTKNYGVAFPVKFYGALDAEQVAELEDRDDRAVLKSSKSDYYWKGWRLLKTTGILVSPSKEKLFCETIGIGNINRWFPQRRGLKKNGDPYLPTVVVDEKGNIEINGREAIQTVFRMAELPDFVAEAICAGEAGEGPKIPLRSLSSKLIPAWKADKEAEDTLTTSMSLEEIEKVFPDSALAANFRAATAKSDRVKKIVPYTGAEMKKLETLAGGSMVATHFLKVLEREPSHASDTVLTAVLGAMVAAEKALGADHPALKGISEAIRAAKASVAAPSSDSEDEDSSESENVDPETGESLTD